MSIREKIDRLIEERKAEAVKKNLAHKLKRVVRVLGYPVQSQSASGVLEGGFGYFASDGLHEGWASDLGTDDEIDIPTTDLDTSTRTIAMYFDGTSSGINMQIWYSEDEELLKVDFAGKLVYREERSRLKSYIPDKWEDRLESLFKLAEKRVKLTSDQDNVDKEKRGVNAMKRIVEHLRKTWGV